MLGRDRRDSETSLAEAAPHIAEGPVERFVVAELVVGLRLSTARCLREPAPSRFDAACDKRRNHPLAAEILRQPMDERHEEVRFDRAQLAGIDMKAGSAR